MPVAKTEVFEYTVNTCDRSQPATKYSKLPQHLCMDCVRYETVTWENEELKEVNSTFNTEVKNITTCVFSFENDTTVERVPQVCHHFLS